MKRAWNAVLQYIKSTDLLLIFYCSLAITLSVALLYTLASSNLGPVLDIGRRQYIVQAVAGVLGLTCAIGISLFDYHFLAKMWKLYAPIALFLVILTFFIGIRVDESIDDRAWLRLFGGLTLQPSEIMKIGFILTFSLHLSKVKDELNRLSNVVLLCVHGAVPIILTRLQGDDGTMIIFTFIFLSLLFVAGIDWKYMLAGAAAFVLALPFVWQYLMSDDQRSRILSVYFSEYADPLGIDYQQRLSRISIGSGQVSGSGLFGEEYWYVPKAYNDFIFSFVGQALGFVGAMAVLCLLCAICVRAWRTSFTSVDALGKYICVGVFAMIFAQTVLNMGMCLSLLPVIGITLPFFSAGGTSVVITFWGIGLVLSVYTHSKSTLFYG